MTVEPIDAQRRLTSDDHHLTIIENVLEIKISGAEKITSEELGYQKVSFRSTKTKSSGFVKWCSHVAKLKEATWLSRLIM